VNWRHASSAALAFCTAIPRSTLPTRYPSPRGSEIDHGSDSLKSRLGSRLASLIRTVLTLQMEAWLPVTGGLNKCRGVATKMVTFVFVRT